MASCNSWQNLVTILAKIFSRFWQDLAKILLRYPWRVDPGRQYERLDLLIYTFDGNQNFFIHWNYGKRKIRKPHFKPEN